MTDSLIPSDALEGLMKKVFLEQNLQTGLFWDAVLKSSLYIPLAKGKGEPGQPATDLDIENMAVQLGIDSNGKEILWIFTSAALLNDYTDNSLSHLELNGQELFGKLFKVNFEVVLIGPEEITLSLDPKFMEELSKGNVPIPAEENVHHIPKNTQVRVGPVAEDTSLLELKYINLFKNLPQVLEAVFIQVADHQSSRVLLGLRLKEDNQEELKKVAAAVARASEGVLPKGKTMDITLISGSLKEAFEKHGKKFYEQ